MRPDSARTQLSGTNTRPISSVHSTLHRGGANGLTHTTALVGRGSIHNFNNHSLSSNEERDGNGGPEGIKKIKTGRPHILRPLKRM